MPALEDYELTEAEKLAKQQFKLFYKEGFHTPCDINIIDVLPPWYDERKYKRGQRYFLKNRLGILNSYLMGLIYFLAEPIAFHILSSEGERYITTLLYVLKWYEVDLTPGSESRKYLAIVQKLHFVASNSAKGKKIGHITQGELSITQFGFMGLPLIRADFFGIKSDNQEDREAFVHLWAVLCYMIGIKDEYNIGLLRYDVLEIVCQMFMRYVVVPVIQVEFPEFKEMVKVMLNEFGNFFPFMDYESQIFRAKLILGLPGYQYRADRGETLLCRSILNQNDIDEIKKCLIDTKAIHYNRLSVDIPIIEKYEINKCEVNDENKNLEIINEFEEMIHSLARLTNKERMNIYFVDYEQELCKSLSDEKFYQLSKKAQKTINFLNYLKLLLDYKIPKCLINFLVGFILVHMMKKKSPTKNSKRNFFEILFENVSIKLIFRRCLFHFVKQMIKLWKYFWKS